MAIVLEADRRRELAGMNHTAFAAYLHISPQLWSLTRSGRRPVRRKVATAIVQRFPDLRPMALRELETHLLANSTPGE